MLETDRVQKLAAQGALDTEFADTEQGIILTARPEELQKFVSNQVHDGLVFGEIHRLHHPGPGE